MYHKILRDASLYDALLKNDLDLAASTRAGGCAACGGRLHSARYPLRQAVVEFPNFKLEANRKALERAEGQFLAAFNAALTKAIREAKKATLSAADLGVLQSTQRRVHAAIARELERASRTAVIARGSPATPPTPPT